MPTKIAIIGTGSVGSTTAYACLMSNFAAEIMLVDINELDCKGEVLDLSDALFFNKTSKISQATLKQVGQADIIIVTAGKAQKKGQPRSELLQINQQIIKQIIEEMHPINPHAILIIVTNPVDTLTLYAQQITKLPKKQVFGSGTLLDSLRLRNLIAEKIGIAEQSIHAYVLGEHGDSQVAALSSATIAGSPLTNFIEKSELNAIAKKAQQKVYEIIQYKNFTCYGIASCLAATCENIIFNQKRIIPVSCYIQEYDICMSMPAIIVAQGIKSVLRVPLDSQESKKLQDSISKLEDMKRNLQ
jgi:L-lactate dehydrogenase